MTCLFVSNIVFYILRPLLLKDNTKYKIQNIYITKIISIFVKNKNRVLLKKETKYKINNIQIKVIHNYFSLI
jgi:hypothetical protein